jgi:hypothetical protein
VIPAFALPVLLAALGHVLDGLVALLCYQTRFGIPPASPSCNRDASRQRQRLRLILGKFEQGAVEPYGRIRLPSIVKNVNLRVDLDQGASRTG